MGAPRLGGKSLLIATPLLVAGDPAVPVARRGLALLGLDLKTSCDPLDFNVFSRTLAASLMSLRPIFNHIHSSLSSFTTGFEDFMQKIGLLGFLQGYHYL
ncbi:hypothetical protein KSP40_PGU014460 [Platanthera guangdongensis]|uniref:Uncharacterized protein n=1 Tax=Platanthera guangdongensis TaxID=2320717 RepID=A0ABR2N0Q9_9ASPA